jgi:hypothetical protein
MRFSARLFQGEPFKVSLSEQLATGLRTRERVRDRVAYCTFFFRSKHNGRRVLSPTSTDRSILALPRSLSFLYYVIRPIRLLLKYGW